MRNGWRTCTLGEAFHTVTGNTPPKKQAEFYGDCIPFVKPPELTDGWITGADDNLSEAGAAVARVLPRHSVLVSCIGNLGKTGIADVPVAFNQQINAILPDDSKATPMFVFYWALSPGFQQELQSRAGGTTVPIVNKSKFNQLTIPLPPLAEQQRIVAILDEAFAGIATATAHAEKNLANARELFESHLNAVFTQKGDGWVEKTLGEIADFKNGLNFTKRSKGEKIRIVGVKDFQSSYWIPMDDLETVQIEGVLSEAYTLKKHDILTVRSNGNKQLIGRCILAGEHPGKVSHSGFTIRIRTHSSDAEPKYLTHYLKSGGVREMLVKSGGGTNISSLNQKALCSLPVRLPERREQSRIVTRIEAIKAESVRLHSLYRQKLDALAEIKQSILAKAFAGELTAKADKVLAEAGSEK